MAKQTKRPDESVQNCTVSERQEQVAVALACGKTVAAAARECEVGTATIWGWKKDPEFNGRVAELRRQLTDRAIGRLADMMATTAADSLKGLLAADDEGVRLDAVKAVYELFVNITNANELKARIEQLEAMREGGSRA